jgi:predicted permease
LIRDLRLALRALSNSPGYFAAAVLTLGLAMAANSAIFGAVYAVLLKPLPVRDPQRLVVGWETNPSRNLAVVEVSYRNFQDWQSSSRALTDVAAFGSSAWPLVLEDGADPIRLASIGVSPGFFETLGVRPFLGRFFDPDDERPDLTRPLVLSHRIWRTRFGANAKAVGTSIATSDGRARIVGLAPAELDFPQGVDVWLPVGPVLAGIKGIDGFRDVGVLFIVGRLRDGLSPIAATTDLDRVAADAAARGGRRFGSAVRLTGFLDYQLGPVRAALWWLSGAVTVLLLIACGNVTALLLTRALQQKREQAIRVALGASDVALWRPWVIESVLVSIAGGLSGLIAARWLLAAIVALAPDDVPRLTEMSVNLPMGLFTFAVGLAAALVTACAPILQSRRRHLVIELNEGRDGRERLPQDESHPSRRSGRAVRGAHDCCGPHPSQLSQHASARSRIYI